MKHIKMFEKFRKGSDFQKKYEEFIMGDTETAPVIAPPSTPTTTPRPWRPVPTTVTVQAEFSETTLGLMLVMSVAVGKTERVSDGCVSIFLASYFDEILSD